MQNNIIVTMPSSALRAMGREMLKEQWLKAIMGALVYMAVLTLPVLLLGSLSPADGQPTEALFYSFFMSGPFTLGYAMFAVAVFRRDPAANPGWIFSGWNRTFKSIGIFIFLCMIYTLGFLLFIVPGIFLCLRYSQVYYIFADHPDWTIVQMMRESARLMKGNYGKYFCLTLSFIGWALVAGVVGSLVSSFCINMFAASYSTAGLGLHALMNVPSFGLTALVYSLCVFSSNVGAIVLTAYVYSSTIAMYEIMNGNLRPKYADHSSHVVTGAKDGWERTDQYFDALPIGSRAYYEALEDELYEMERRERMENSAEAEKEDNEVNRRD